MKRIGQFVLDTLEIYLPVIAFIIMFFVFLLQIFYRYILNNPLTWPYEIKVAGYLWTTMLGACYVRRLGTHVSFDMAYQNRSPLGKKIFRIISNSLVLAACIIALNPTYQYLQYMQIEKTTVLRIPFSYVFSPVLVFIILIAGHSLYDIIVDLFFKSRKD